MIKVQQVILTTPLIGVGHDLQTQLPGPYAQGCELYLDEKARVIEIRLDGRVTCVPLERVRQYELEPIKVPKGRKPAGSAKRALSS